MSDFTTLGDDQKLKIKVPVKGATNWGDTMKSDTFQKIADHDHSGADGKGTKISKVGDPNQQGDTEIDSNSRILLKKSLRITTLASPPSNAIIGDLYIDNAGTLKICTQAEQAGPPIVPAVWASATASYDLKGATDANFDSVADGQMLVYNSTANAFEPFTKDVGNLNDVDTTGVTDGDLMVYDSATSKWKPDSRAGEVIMWAKASHATTPPKNALFCDGSAVSRTTYAQLFAIIGTDYGTGDGTNTFNLPNYDNVFFRGAGSTRGNPATTQTAGTALPTTTPFDFVTDNPGNHNHDNGSYSRLLKQDGTSTNQYADNSASQPNLASSADLVGRGEHSHSPASWSGGDSETRPANTAIAYYIRYK